MKWRFFGSSSVWGLVTAELSLSVIRGSKLSKLVVLVLLMPSSFLLAPCLLLGRIGLGLDWLLRGLDCGLDHLHFSLAGGKSTPRSRVPGRSPACRRSARSSERLTLSSCAPRFLFT